MTDKPTDEALENLFVEETGFDTDDFPAAIFGFARAVLAKWGQPAQKTVTVVPATGDVWLKHDDDLRYVRRVLEAGRQMTDVDQRGSDFGHASISISASPAWASAFAATSVRAPAHCPNSSAAVSARSMTAAGARLGRLARKA